MTRDVLPHAMGNGHPAFFGWVNSPPALAGVLASLTAAAMNPSVVAGDHADVHVERTAVRWLAELVGYPHAPGAGLLTSGASAATIVCLAGARGRASAAAGHDVRRSGLVGGPRLVAYVPSEAHSCVPRALELLGLGSDSIRPVPLPGGRLDADALRGAIAADRAAGATPALLVGSAGTVNTGAIDPLDALARSRRRRAALVPRRRGLRRLRRARPGAGRALPGHGARRLVDARSAQVARRPRRRRLRAGAPRRRPARRVQRRPALPAPGRGRGGRHFRRVRPRADAAVPCPEDVGDDRRPWPRGHRRPGRARERAGPRARRAGRARAVARTRGHAGDVDRGVPRPAARMRAGPHRGRQPRAARGRPGAGAGVRDRHGLRGTRDHARLHPAPGHHRGRPGRAGRRGDRGRRRPGGRGRATHDDVRPVGPRCA